MFFHQLNFFVVPPTMDDNDGFTFEGPPVDYVLVHDKNDTVFNQTRQYFERALKKAGLIINKETVGSEIYSLITAPFERLAYEAEQVKLEMDLKGVFKNKLFIYKY